MEQTGFWRGLGGDVAGWLFMAATAVGPAMIVVGVTRHEPVTGIVGGLVTACVVPVWIVQLRRGAASRRAAARARAERLAGREGGTRRRQ